MARGTWVAAVAGAMGLLMTGCAGFFPPLTTTATTTPTPSTGADFVYVANQVGNSIAGFQVSTSTAGAGTLTALTGSPYGLPLSANGQALSPTAMAISPNNSFLYVAGLGGIFLYTINSSTGVLTLGNAGSQVAITPFPSASMDVSPDGQWLFALSQDGVTLQEYAINASTGVLSQQPNIGYVPGNGATVVPKMVKVAPNGAYVALALGTGGDAVFSFSPSTGALGGSYYQIPTGSATTSDNALTIDAGSAYLYIARSGTSSGVAAYGLGSGGLPTAVTGSPFATGNGPFAVLLDSTGKYLYAANRTDGTVSSFTTAAGGVLTAISGAAVAGGSAVNALARDNSGKYVLSAASGGSPDLTLFGFDAITPGKLDVAATAATGTDPVSAVVVVATH